MINIRGATTTIHGGNRMDAELQQQAEAAAQEIQRNLMALQMCLAEIEYQIELMEGRQPQ
jgi:hypothetical protein